MKIREIRTKLHTMSQDVDTMATELYHRGAEDVVIGADVAALVEELRKVEEALDILRQKMYNAQA